MIKGIKEGLCTQTDIRLNFFFLEALMKRKQFSKQFFCRKKICVVCFPTHCSSRSIRSIKVVARVPFFFQQLFLLLFISLLLLLVLLLLLLLLPHVATHHIGHSGLTKFSNYLAWSDVNCSFVITGRLTSHGHCVFWILPHKERLL